jgi:transcriptional regulator with XRE-family HTH domain
MKKIGEIVRSQRRRRKWTQAKLAEVAGVSLMTVVKLEAGTHTNPTIRTLRRLAQALKISIHDLI